MFTTIRSYFIYKDNYIIYCYQVLLGDQSNPKYSKNEDICRLYKMKNIYAKIVLLKKKLKLVPL